MTLLANPQFFYGAGGLLPYFTGKIEGNADFGFRAFGASLLAMAAGPHFDGTSELAAKVMGVGAVLMVPLMAKSALDETGTYVKAVWQAQLAIHLVVTYLLVNAAGWL